VKAFISFGIFLLVMAAVIPPMRAELLASVNSYIARIPVSPAFAVAFVAVVLVFATRDFLCRGDRA
jgi:hypothetical protein